MHLSFLQLCSLKFSSTSWTLIANALKKNCTIQILILNAMNLKPSAWEILSPAFAQNRSVETLDLSYNYMGDSCSSYLTRLIANQSERRDNCVWLHGLRGEVPET